MQCLEEILQVIMASLGDFFACFCKEALFELAEFEEMLMIGGMGFAGFLLPGLDELLGGLHK